MQRISAERSAEGMDSCWAADGDQTLTLENKKVMTRNTAVREEMCWWAERALKTFISPEFAKKGQLSNSCALMFHRWV